MRQLDGWSVRAPKRFPQRNENSQENLILDAVIKVFKQMADDFNLIGNHQIKGELGKKRIDVTEPPTLDEVEEFWANIWENDKTHNENAKWIKRLEDMQKNLESQSWAAINAQEVTKCHKQNKQLEITG